MLSFFLLSPAPPGGGGGGGWSSGWQCCAVLLAWSSRLRRWAFSPPLTGSWFSIRAVAVAGHGRDVRAHSAVRLSPFFTWPCVAYPPSASITAPWPLCSLSLPSVSAHPVRPARASAGRISADLPKVALGPPPPPLGAKKNKALCLEARRNHLVSALSRTRETSGGLLERGN